MIKRLLSYVREYKAASIATPCFMVIEVIMEMVVPLMMASLVDNGIDKGDMGHILKIGGFMVIAAVIGLFGGILGGKYAAKASTGFAKNLRKGMFDRIQTFSFANIDKFSTAGLVTRLTTDVTNVQNAYQMMLRMCMRAPATLIIAMVMSFSINAKISSIFLVAIVVLSCILAFIMSRAMKAFEQAFPKYDDLNSSVQENVSAIRVVKAYVREDHEIGKFKKASNNIYKIFSHAEKITTFNGPVMNITVYTCILLISWIGAKMIVSSHQTELTTGNLISLLSYNMAILMNLMMLSMIFIMISMSMASFKRINEVLTEVPDITNPEKPVWEVADGSIEFDHVNFRYKKDGNENVLSDINLKIKSGETIGIIGSTGSAKSTLVNLISRLYDVNDGSVKVGGRDVREYDIEALRDEVSVVLQKNVLFSGTIIENLCWGLRKKRVKDENGNLVILRNSAQDGPTAVLNKTDKAGKTDGSVKTKDNGSKNVPVKGQKPEGPDKMPGGPDQMPEGAFDMNAMSNASAAGTIIWESEEERKAVEEECKRVCRLACADEFIEKMPDGYNTHIEQGGANVSGGQKQRLCIARALMKKPKILILDDSTSAVDTATDAKIRKAFAEEIPGTTKLIIAQRIASVKDADRIIVMDDGKVNGFGTHDELMASNAIYRDVYESQTGGSGDFDEAAGGDK
ncbi:MAG: ABC transporter ATP-binding protein/permease [Lachnospiraceae bacterium]|nr:ABC transporter ATP-binding protein/permease [Lachnospiraceae bacterium]